MNDTLVHVDESHKIALIGDGKTKKHITGSMADVIGAVMEVLLVAGVRVVVDHEASSSRREPKIQGCCIGSSRPKRGSDKFFPWWWWWMHTVVPWSLLRSACWSVGSTFILYFNPHSSQHSRHGFRSKSSVVIQ
jgi:hypothetical protein